jgi:hypothetical protein
MPLLAAMLLREDIMKTDEWLLVGAAGLLVFLFLRARPAGGTVQIGEPTTLFNDVVDSINEVLNSATQGQPGFGWRYFDNGVAISPEGQYYKNGALVYSPMGNGATGSW